LVFSSAVGFLTSVFFLAFSFDAPFFTGVFFLPFSCVVALLIGVFFLAGVLGFCGVVLAFFLQRKHVV
jgi:hypothetical protein